MKAITIAAYGNADKFEMTVVPAPKVGPNDVKVRMAKANGAQVWAGVRSKQVAQAA